MDNYTPYSAPWGTDITDVIITNVKNIGEYAFHGCTELKNIEIPDGVTIIGDSAFKMCERITHITILDSVVSIDDWAFGCCTSLTSINIPNGIISIGFMIFFGCDNLENITVDKGNKVYHSDGNCIIKTADKELVVGCKNSLIPSNGSVTSIGGSAFYGCRGLTSITIPNCITSIGNGAFSNCVNLESITVDKGNKVYHSDGNCIINTAEKELIAGCKNSLIPSNGSVTSIGGSAFDGCTGLTSITIPDNVTSIEDGAFGVSGLANIEIPDSVTHIGNLAFYQCNKLASITLPNGVISIGDSAFFGTDYYCCNSNWENGALYISNHLIKVRDKLKEYTIKDETITVADNAFENCSELTFITVPNSVMSIGDFAFDGCTGLADITIPDSVASIGDCAFRGCTGLTSIEIPYSVTSIGYGASYGCVNLESITVDRGNKVYHSDGNCIINTAEKELIAGCKNSIVTTDNSVVSIDEFAFYGCTGLTDITIPDSVTSIGEMSFYECTGLTSITIPDSVASIGWWAFDGCTHLTINCYKNSEAYRYAVSHNIPYRLIKDNTFAPDAPAVATKTYNTVVLIAVEGYEYSTDSKVWQKSNVFTGLSEDTEYTFYQRIAETDTTYASESSAPLKVRTYFCGDINGDGKINSTDLSMLRKKIISGNTDYAENPQCDIKIDGKIDILDLIKLKKLAVENA